MTVTKTINLELVGLDGNAYSLMGAFQRQARREGWTAEEITAVLDEAKRGDYNHLICTLSDHCDPQSGEGEGEDEYEDGDDE